MNRHAFTKHVNGGVTLCVLCKAITLTILIYFTTKSITAENIAFLWQRVTPCIAFFKPHDSEVWILLYILLDTYFLWLYFCTVRTMRKWSDGAMDSVRELITVLHRHRQLHPHQEGALLHQ